MKSHATALTFFSIILRSASLGCTVSCRALMSSWRGRSISISLRLGGATLMMRSALNTSSALSTTWAPASV